MSTRRRELTDGNVLRVRPPGREKNTRNDYIATNVHQ